MDFIVALIALMKFMSAARFEGYCGSGSKLGAKVLQI